MALTNNENVKRKCEIDVTDLGKRGVRCLAVAKTDKNGKNYLFIICNFIMYVVRIDVYNMFVILF